MEKMPTLLIRCGLIILIYGFFKNTAVDTPLGQMHNIGLMQQSQNFMLIGLLMFIGGLLLKGQSKGGGSEKPSKINESKHQEYASLGLLERASSNYRLLSRKRKSLAVQLDAFRDRFFLRLGVGFGAGVLALNIVVFFCPVALTFISCTIFSVLAMRNLPSRVAIRNVLMVTSFPSLAILLFTIASQVLSSEASTSLVITASMPPLVLIAGYMRFRRLSKP